VVIEHRAPPSLSAPARTAVIDDLENSVISNDPKGN
jgi:hypothetical protein